MRVTIHNDNSHSENPQQDPVVVETGSNVTLTCHAAQKSILFWHVNSTYKKVPNCKNVETCNLTLPWTVAGGNYTCTAHYNGNCFNSKVLELKVVGESRVIQVPKYYRSYYYYYYYYYDDDDGGDDDDDDDDDYYNYK